MKTIYMGFQKEYNSFLPGHKPVSIENWNKTFPGDKLSHNCLVLCLHLILLHTSKVVSPEHLIYANILRLLPKAALRLFHIIAMSQKTASDQALL